jgi:pSer/pThr/pTyr-binding forkhead associated (FHA) protein
MNGQTAAQIMNFEIMLTVLTGPEAGVAYKLIGETVSLGRSSENDVIIHDNKSSRHHARIERRGDEFWIIDLGSTAGMLVNNKETKECSLHPGDEITIGMIVMRFGFAEGLALVKSHQVTAQVAITSSSPMPGPASAAVQPGLPPLPLTKNLNLNSEPATWWQNANANPPRSRKPKKNYLPMFLIAIVALVALFFWKGGTGKRPGFKVKDEALLEQEIQATTESNEQKQQLIAKAGKDTQQYIEAQAFYLRGSREYNSGNYNRAVQEFQTALSIYPNHPLARRYLEESRIKNNQTITDSLERAEKAFQLEKYRIAKSEYKNVMRLSGDPNNKNSQLAYKRLETIELILQNNL